MDPCEQFFTSLCSRKAYLTIKTHFRATEGLSIRTKGNFDFCLDDYETIFMEFHQSSEVLNQELEEFIIDGNSTRYELDEDDVTTYWTEPIVGTMKLIEYVCDLFNVEVNFMAIKYDSGDRLMKWVQQRQKRLETVRFDSKKRKKQFDTETLKRLLMDCEAERIVSNAHTTQSLQIQNFYKKCDYFGVNAETWFTLENLMTLDCIEILVGGKRFTSTEMNRFFKHWMSGGSPRLTLLKIELDNYNEQELMKGIDVKWNMRSVHVCTSEEGATCLFDGFFEIQKTTNGMSAGFKLENGLLCFGVWPCCFNLFRLPHLAFINIINEMNTTEQFLTSLCSRRTFSTIKTLCRKSNEIRITAGGNCLVIYSSHERLISYQFKKDPRRDDTVKVNGKSSAFSSNAELSKINTFWEEPIVGTMELVEHVTSLFGIQVDTVVINNDSGTRFMNWVQKNQKFLRMVEVNSYNSMEYQFESEDLKNIIMECKADSIQLNALHSSPFKIQNLRKKFEKFECLRGTWITVDNLMTLDCIDIKVKERQFTCAELNRFIKHWLKGGSPRFETLRVVVDDLNLHELLDRLNARWNTEKMVMLNNHPNAFNICEVVRSDGITAGFQFFNGFFWFGVWPTGNGNVLYLDSF
uniref:FBA_2 domain-containing protein n=1 Tax=Caenorhabditis tropicalis TaxID=1561998 RepID=A0A1I7U584_9PELO